MNILSACLSFLGRTVQEGVQDLTWEIMRKKGQALIDNFKKRFVHFFADEIQAELYLKAIAEKECYNEEDPVQDGASLYRKMNPGGDKAAFTREFSGWLKEQEEELRTLSRYMVNSTAGITIGQQNVYGGKVKNVGIEYHKR